MVSLAVRVERRATSREDEDVARASARLRRLARARSPRSTPSADDDDERARMTSDEMCACANDAGARDMARENAPRNDVMANELVEG